MGTLQDQLLKSGLVTRDQLRSAQAEQRRAKRSARGDRARRGSRADAKNPIAQAPAHPAKSPPAPPSTPAKGEPSVQALNLKIRELLDRHAVNDKGAEVPFHFLREDSVRRVYVTNDQRTALADGTLAIVGFRRRHHLVPAGVADEIHALRPIVFIHRADAGTQSDEGGDERGAADDPYREFPIPDDLHW